MRNAGLQVFLSGRCRRVSPAGGLVAGSPQDEPSLTVSYPLPSRERESARCVSTLRAGRAEGQRPSAFFLSPKNGSRGLTVEQIAAPSPSSSGRMARNDRFGGLAVSPRFMFSVPLFQRESEGDWLRELKTESWDTLWHASWIPAFAGMTEFGACRGAQPLCVTYHSPFPKGGIRGIGHEGDWGVSPPAMSHQP